MRSSLRPALLAVALTLAAPAVHAQSASANTGPRAGSWGAEATYGEFSGASLLRFSSSDAAWVLGLSGYAERRTVEQQIFNGVGYVTTKESQNVDFVTARLGRRWWGGDARTGFRPLTGVGITGGVGQQPSFRQWNAGTYGELGATYFFSPHVSLGATGGLELTYGQDRFNSGSGSTDHTDRWIVRGNLARVSAGVYF
jgi:hypothetical protein